MRSQRLTNKKSLRECTFVIGPNGEEYKETFKNAKRKLDRLLAAAVPCKKTPNSIRETCASRVTAKPEIEPEKNSKTVFGCFVESHESTRQRAESLQSKIHEDRIAGKGFTSMTHYNLAHKLIPMPQAMKIPDAKAAVDKEWKKLETIPAWNLDKVKSKKEVILEAAKRQKKSPL